MRVLVTEDDPAIRMLLCKQAEHWGYAAQGAGNGAEAVAAVLSGTPPDIIIMDWMMPVMSGIEACRRIRERTDLPPVYIMMLTSKRGRADIILGLEAGADDYLTKPIDSGELQSRLKVAARTVEYEKKLREYGQEMELLAQNRANQLIAADRLVTVGTMVSGIAHEISSPLSAIIGSSQLMRDYWDCFRPLLFEAAIRENSAGISGSLREFQEMLDCLEQSGRKINDLVRALKDFYRQKTGETTEICAINDCVENALRICRPGLKQRVKVETDLTQPPPLALVIARQIEQALINIINNAAEAIIGAQRRDGLLRIETGQDSAAVRVRVINNGPEIPQEQLERIWNNFFTTKEEGTGLGLPISAEIMRRHGGRISAENISGGGVCFTLELPALPELA